MKSNLLSAISGDRPASVMVAAGEALQNRIHVKPGLPFPAYKYGERIDWEAKGDNSWYLYFQSLQVVGYLAYAAEETKHEAQG